MVCREGSEKMEEATGENGGFGTGPGTTARGFRDGSAPHEEHAAREDTSRPCSSRGSTGFLASLASLALLALLMAGVSCIGIASGGEGTGGGGASAGGGGQEGTGGSTGTGGGGGGSTGTGGGGGGSTGTGGGGTVSPGTCPADAYFCSGFEEASGLPQGATFQDPDESGGGTTFDQVMALDKTAPFDGAQSLKVTSTGSFSFRMLGVAVPTNTFWVRLFIKSDQDIGQDGHNAFLEAMTNPNYHDSTSRVEIAEQFTCVLLNEHDALFPAGNTCGANKALPKDTWHCLEAMFDGTTGDVQVFADKTQIINATAWAPAKAAFTTFEFGFATYHGPGRNIWYDDVVVAPTRVGCP